MKISTIIDSSAGKRKKAGSGFTIVELLLVAAIIALLAGAVGGIYLGTYKRTLVEREARGILLTAKYARVRAIERRTPCKLLLDRKKNGYCVVTRGFNAGTNETEKMVVSNEYTRPKEFGGDVKFEGIKIMPAFGSDMGEMENEDVIVFRADGTADTAVLQIGDGKNHYAVYVSAATGKARMQPGEATEAPIGIIDLDAEEI